MPVKMNPIEPAATDAILVGDPRRAFALAQELTVRPRMSHQARGLWGYTGETAGGTSLTVQSTGSGGPAAVPVIGDLADQGVTRMVRLGTCLANDPDIEAGTVLLVQRALIRDGAAAKLSSGAAECLPDPDLLSALATVGRPVTVSSHDLVGRFEPTDGQGETAGVARDLQTATLLAMARRLELQAAAVLVVAEDQSGTRLDEETLTGIFRPVGRKVAERLAPPGNDPPDSRESKPEVEG